MLSSPHQRAISTFLNVKDNFHWKGAKWVTSLYKARYKRHSLSHPVKKRYHFSDFWMDQKLNNFLPIYFTQSILEPLFSKPWDFTPSKLSKKKKAGGMVESITPFPLTWRKRRRFHTHISSLIPAYSTRDIHPIAKVECQNHLIQLQWRKGDKQIH